MNGTNSFWVEDTELAWYLESGSARLFLVANDADETPGPRRFVCEVGEGCVFVVPRAAMSNGLRLLCTVNMNTSIKVQSLHSLDAFADGSKSHIEDWMKNVGHVLDPKGAWLASRRSFVRAHNTKKTKDSRIFSSRVQAFCEMAVMLTTSHAELADTRELQRIRLAQNNDSESFSAAMGDITSGLLDEVAFGRPRSGDLDGDGLLAACRFLEPSLKVRFVSSKTQELHHLDDGESIELLAEGSSVRARRVLLDGKWWNEESGPLLARMSDNESQAGANRRWVALLPRAVSGYQIFSAEPIDGLLQGEVLTEAMSTRLAPFAYTFYRIFPNQRLSAIDIVKFGIEGRTKDIGILLLASLAAGALGLLVPIISGKLIDVVIPAKNELAVWQFAVGLLVAGVSALLFDAFRSVAVLRLEAGAGMSIQAAILDRVISLPVSFFRRFSSGDLSARMAAVNSIQQAVTGSTISTLLTSIFLFANLGLMFWFNLTMTIAALGVVLVLLLVSSGIGYARLQLSRKIEDISGKLQSMVFEYLSGISKIHAAGAEKRAFVNWTNRFLMLRRFQVRGESLANAETLLLNILLPAMLLLVYFYAANAALPTLGNASGKPFTTGDFVAFNAALFGLVGGLYSMMTTAIELVQLLPVWERAKPILESLPEAADKRNARHEPNGGIEVINLSFRYPDGPQVLDDISFSVSPGSFVAIVGSSGSGKSTLVRLLLGFEKCLSGSVCYDGHDLAGLDSRYFRSRVGTVLQSGQLWPGDIYSNIAGASVIPVEQVWEAARLAGLKDDIELMPMGLYTSIGDAGSTLSGGQKQRILIARAVVHRPRILLMDEATSSLDNVTQASVQRALADLECTRLIIAHRLSTVRHADTILVMNQGKLVERGNYDQLADKNGLFSELLKRQLA